MSTVNLTTGSDVDADVKVPCSSELHNASLDASITPKAAASCDDDVCSTTLVDEATNSVVAGDGLVDLKPLSPAAVESHNGYADDACEQPVGVVDDMMFYSSEGESLLLLSHYVVFAHHMQE